MKKSEMVKLMTKAHMDYLKDKRGGPISVDKHNEFILDSQIKAGMLPPEVTIYPQALEGRSMRINEWKPEDNTEGDV